MTWQDISAKYGAWQQEKRKAVVGGPWPSVVSVYYCPNAIQGTDIDHHGYCLLGTHCVLGALTGI